MTDTFSKAFVKELADFAWNAVEREAQREAAQDDFPAGDLVGMTREGFTDGVRAVLAYLARKGVEGLPDPEEIAEAWDVATMDPDPDLGRAANVLDLVAARVAPLLAARDAALAEALDESANLAVELTRTRTALSLAVDDLESSARDALRSEYVRAEAAEKALVEAREEIQRWQQMAKGWGCSTPAEVEESLSEYHTRTLYGKHSAAGADDQVDELRKQNQALQESLAEARAESSAARSRADGLQALLDAAPKRGELAEARDEIERLRRERDTEQEKRRQSIDVQREFQAERDALRARLAAVLALTAEVVSDCITRAMVGTKKRLSDDSVDIDMRERHNAAKAVLDLIRSRAGGGEP